MQEYIEFVKLVQVMRLEQKIYFKNRNNNHLRMARALEKQVDSRIEEILASQHPQEKQGILK